MNQASSLLAFQHAHPPLFPSLLPLHNHRARCLSLIPRAEPEDDNTLSNSQESTVSDPKKPSGSGSGFGTLTESKNKKGKGKEKRSVIRRSPIERPSSLYQSDGAGSASNEERSVNEGAFLLTWLGLGFLILIEGVALAASGFLPEEWDNFFVKYLYPSFTPTVLLFISGTVAYGVLKYLQEFSASAPSSYEYGYSLVSRFEGFARKPRNCRNPT
ncbi:hypothetical protein J5N97_019111 [Dioscorea zingiberensis]|uniref:Protein LOW PSII ACCUMULATION 2, chloroplastic n=1 Tax=Dioscorea zingiberensis TaxID=325984 RepID=A0A9D5CDC3_9LILI|nr:hypothetical protein J5N97_019111 [Dioscorea zingiberensis]